MGRKFNPGLDMESVADLDFPEGKRANAQATGQLPSVSREQQDDDAVLANQIKQFYECFSLFVAYPTATLGRIRTHGNDYEITLIEDGKDISQRSLPVDGIRDYFRQYKSRDVNAAQQIIYTMLSEWSLVVSDEHGNTYKTVAVQALAQTSPPFESESTTDAGALLRSMLSESLDKNKIAKNGSNEVQFPDMAVMQEIESAKKAFLESAIHLTAADWQVLAAEAERRATANKTVAELAAAPDRPMLYRDRPRGQDLIAFLRQEYKDRGLLTGAFNRADLKKYDPDAAQAIAAYEHRRALLPDDVRIPKARARTSPRELNSK